MRLENYQLKDHCFFGMFSLLGFIMVFCVVVTLTYQPLPIRILVAVFPAIIFCVFLAPGRQAALIRATSSATLFSCSAFPFGRSGFQSSSVSSDRSTGLTYPFRLRALSLLRLVPVLSLGLGDLDR